MKVYAVPLLVALFACQERTPPLQPGAAEATLTAEPLSGRILDSGQGRYGELSALREKSGTRLLTVVAYRTGGMTDPSSGQNVAITVSGLEIECDAGRTRYTYHQGRSPSGEALYQVALPANVRWNSGERVSSDVKLLCADPPNEQIVFEGAADFLEKTAEREPPVDVVVSTTSERG